MAKINFYTNPMSRGQIARWALHEVGADYEQHLLDYGTTMKSPEFLAINPMGKVPAIVQDGHIVTECAAICVWLADAFPASGLGPTPAERADYYRWLFFAAGPVEAAVTNRALGFTPAAEQEAMAGYGNFAAVMDALDAKLTADAYICADRFTMADVYLGAQVDWGLQFGSMEERASFQAYAERLRARPAYQAAKAIDNQLIAESQSSAQ
jgi:glutathione S-transferase